MSPLPQGQTRLDQHSNLETPCQGHLDLLQEGPLRLEDGVVGTGEIRTIIQQMSNTRNSKRCWRVATGKGWQVSSKMSTETTI